MNATTGLGGITLEDLRPVAGGVGQLSHEQLAHVAEGGTVEVAGHVLSAAELDIRREPNPGTVVESFGGLAVALDTTLDDDLVIEGLARDIVSQVQQVRRDLDLDVSDRITLAWASADDEVQAAFARHGDWIAGEVLATEVRMATSGDVAIDCAGHVVAVTVRRAA